MTITSSLSGEFPCHVAIAEVYDPLWDDSLDFIYPDGNRLTLTEKASTLRTRLPAAGTTNVPLPASKEFRTRTQCP